MTMKLVAPLVALTIGCLGASPAWAQAAAHTMVSPADLKWADVPSLPPGAKIAVIEGPPTEAVPFTFRLKFPDNYKILLIGTRPSNTSLPVASSRRSRKYDRPRSDFVAFRNPFIQRRSSSSKWSQRRTARSRPTRPSSGPAGVARARARLPAAQASRSPSRGRDGVYAQHDDLEQVRVLLGHSRIETNIAACFRKSWEFLKHATR